MIAYIFIPNNIIYIIVAALLQSTDHLMNYLNGVYPPEIYFRMEFIKTIYDKIKSTNLSPKNKINAASMLQHVSV